MGFRGSSSIDHLGVGGFLRLGLSDFLIWGLGLRAQDSAFVLQSLGFQTRGCRPCSKDVSGFRV